MCTQKILIQGQTSPNIEKLISLLVSSYYKKGSERSFLNQNNKELYNVAKYTLAYDIKHLHRVRRIGGGVRTLIPLKFQLITFT